MFELTNNVLETPGAKDWPLSSMMTAFAVPTPSFTENPVGSNPNTTAARDK
jgi:hypothetical protein